MHGVYFDKIPNYCSNCGTKLHLDDKYNHYDFIHKNSFSCNCGVQYIYVEEDKDLSKQITDELNYYRNR